MELKIHLTNFGPFKERQTYTFSNINIFYGPSGSGKSVLNHALRLFAGNPTTINEFHHFEMSDIMDFDALLYDNQKPFVLELEILVGNHVMNRKYCYGRNSKYEGYGDLLKYELFWDNQLVYGFDKEFVFNLPHKLNVLFNDLIELCANDEFKKKVGSFYRYELLDGILPLTNVSKEWVEDLFSTELNYTFMVKRTNALNFGWSDEYDEYMRTFECVVENHSNGWIFKNEIAECLRNLYETPFSFFQGHYTQFDPFKSRDNFSGTVVKTSYGSSYKFRLKNKILDFVLLTVSKLGLPLIVEQNFFDAYNQKIGYSYYTLNKKGRAIHYSMLGEGEKRLYDLIFQLAFIYVEQFDNKERTDPYLFIVDNIDIISTGKGNAELLIKLSDLFPNILFVCVTKSRELVNEMLSLCEEQNYKSSALSISSFKKNKGNFTASITNHEISETFSITPGI
jgi:hypothetical protein